MYNGVSALLQAGYNPSTAARWDGTSGIVTSQSNATASNFHSIGIATAAQAKKIAPGATALFAGETVTGSDTLVMYTYGGDANLDGKVNVDDYVRIDSNVGLGNATASWFNGDFNYDGKVNVDDYVIIDSNAGIAGTALPTGAGAGTGTALGAVAVPEPASMSLLALGAMAILGRRRRQQARHDG